MDSSFYAANHMLYLPPTLVLGPIEKDYLDYLIAYFQLTLCHYPPSEDFYLSWENQCLNLKKSNDNALKVDFTQSTLQQRAQHRNSEQLIKAVNTKKYKNIWDATAGLGTDAFLMAACGASVTLFERHPWVAALLADGLHRAAQITSLQSTLSRMRLIFGQIYCKTAHYNYPPDIIYLDPMFPTTKKSALVKKNMQFLQALLKVNQDDAALLSHAMQLAKHKVVVKRSKHAAPINNGFSPSYCINGPSVRYDIYITHTKKCSESINS